MPEQDAVAVPTHFHHWKQTGSARSATWQSPLGCDRASYSDCAGRMQTSSAARYVFAMRSIKLTAH